MCTLDTFLLLCDLLLPACSLDAMFARTNTFHFVSIEKKCGEKLYFPFLHRGHAESSCSIVKVSARSSINGNVKWVNYGVNVWGKWCEMWHANNKTPDVWKKRRRKEWRKSQQKIILVHKSQFHLVSDESAFIHLAFCLFNRIVLK